MTAKKTEPTRHLGLRIPATLHAALTDLARRDNRSLSNFVILALKRAADRKK